MINISNWAIYKIIWINHTTIIIKVLDVEENIKSFILLKNKSPFQLSQKTSPQ